MQETESTESNIDIDKYKKMPLNEALLALEDMSETDATKIIDLRKKELGENPKLVAELFNKPLGDIVQALSGDMSKVDAKTIIKLKDSFGKKPNVKVITELSQLVESLKEMNSTDAEKIIRKNEKDFGRNPAFLRILVKAASKSNELQIAVDKTNIVGTKYLNVKLARALLGSDLDPAVRELRNQVMHSFNSTIPRSKGEEVYYANPQGHAKDSIDDLVKFMINRSESAFSFLRKPEVQTELARNPMLVARMLLKGNANLAETMEKEGVFDLFTGETKEALEHIREIKKAVNTIPLNDTTIGRALKNKLDTLIEMVVERDGKNIIEPKTALSLKDAADLRDEAKHMQALYNQLNEIKTTLNTAPLKDSAHTEEFRAQLKTLEQSVLEGNNNVAELNKILPLAQKLQKDITEKTQETHTVEYIGPPIQALLQESAKEQQREKRAESSSRAVQKKWPQQEKQRTTTIKVSHVAKDSELQKITAELKKPEPVTPPPSSPITPRSPGRR